MINIFIRNDDVRETLDESLLEITDICIRNEVPISHAVEPANVTKEVVDWLLVTKKEYPHLIEIIQHGYDHKIKYNITRYGKIRQGEFGGNRTFEEQYNDLLKGYNLMNTYFGKSWYPLLTLPFGAFNKHTLRAMNKIGYKGLSTSVNFSKKHRIKDVLGRILRVNFLLNRQISYHMRNRPGTNFIDIGVSANIIRKYLNEDEAIHFTNKEILEKISHNSLFTDNIGILLHHRFHKDIIPQFSDLVKHLKMCRNFSFKGIEELYVK